MRGLKLNLILVIFFFFIITSVSAQWVQQNNPSDFYLDDIFFLNTNTGWSCGNTVQKTTDGGSNWISYSNPGAHFLGNIFFIDANTGFLSSFNYYKTTNGGINWTAIPLAHNNFRQTNFINSSTGWVVSHQSAVYKTTNSGNSWTNVSVPTFSNNEGVSFVNANTGWVCGWGGIIFKTTNGGTNWIQQTTGTTSNFNSICFSDANTGRAAGQNGIYIRTTNGGANWESVAGPFANDLERMFFVNSSIGWVTGYNGIALTTNNGTTWINQTPTDLNFFEGVCYIAPSTVFTVARDIYKTVSAGFNLNAPTNLTLTPASTSQINLSWTNNSIDAEKIMIERSTNGSAWILIDSVSGEGTSYQAAGLPSNSEFHFRVYPKKIIFTGGYSNAPFTRSLMVSPTHLSPENGYISTSATPTLSWSSVTGTIFYYLQAATDSLFNNIVYSNLGMDYTSQNIPPGTLQNSKKYYWRTRVTNLTNQSAYSNFWSFVVQDPNYGNNIQTGNNLYYFANSTSASNLSPSKPTFNWRDTTGSIDLILNRTAIATINAGFLDDGRFDLISKLPVGNSVRFFGTNYQNIYIGTNGIIAFNAFTPTGTGYYQPNSALPQGNITNAIFPLWKDLNFGDPDVTVNRLCYKVTDNEIIITYMRAPNYNNTGSDPNDYVSFQVIINHSASPVINSPIIAQYNYDQTGSTFISKYNANTLSPYLIGLQETNSASQILQYRYLDITPQLISQGPMFGSNLALAFGPDATLLPVELSSFSSHISGNKVKLNWATEGEINNSGFEIQRTAASQNNWLKIGFVQGNGTSTQQQNYSFEDNNIASGKYQYRLKQIDFNGNYEYFNLSNEIEIGTPKKFFLSQNYPNPFNPKTIINYQLAINSFVTLKIYDMTGKEVIQIVNQEQNSGYYTVEFNGSNLASGMYFYRIQAGDFSSVKKMVLVK